MVHDAAACQTHSQQCKLTAPQRATNLQSRPIPIAGTRRLPDKSDFNGELELQWSLLGAVSCGLVRLSVLSTVAKRDYADYVTSSRNQDELSE